MLLTTIFCTSFLVALSGALMPGPLLTVTISESVHQGARTGPLIIFGHAILELVLIIALLSGLAPFLNMSQVFVTISLIGGCTLLWMGVSMLRSLPLVTVQTGGTADRYGNLVATGALLSLANPYWLIWWATIGLGYIIQTRLHGLAGIIVFFLGHILADLAWYTLVSFTIARGQHYLNARHYRILIGGCAVFLLLFSSWFFYSGITTFFQLDQGIS